MPLDPPTHSHPRRNFNPKKTARYGRPTFPLDKLVRYSPKWGYTRLFHFPFPGSHFRPRMHSLVASIDGGCRPHANNAAACAAYFGPQSRDNAAKLLDSSSSSSSSSTQPQSQTPSQPQPQPQTSNSAELAAALLALDIVDGKRAAGTAELLRELILMTDSTYVANAMAQWVWTWERNGWRTGKGGEVENRDLIARLHGRIGALERDGVSVRFWRVGREWNEEADGMVRELLDGGE